MAENSSGCESLLRSVPVTPRPGGGEFLRLRVPLRRVPSLVSPDGDESFRQRVLALASPYVSKSLHLRVPMVVRQAS